ncbi:Hpt domain-containing protein [Allomuricauda sp. SCSIO 65647]|uniref:Hpt domain-containing protein n=1 Tax=Allomuricauda sp. SCSIO 65647 TaxID=2908843 RepID=UPI001F2074F6|nr:Hpt domain-containing protein [Muricauda sp. SCSIO 65647]UJH67280.1 Hpt domain-containing protein [Muricauda sp. SCSIO 65647]
METKITPAEIESHFKDLEKSYDLQGLLQECMGQTALLEELIRLFKQNVLEFVGNVKVHLTNDDMKALGFACHKMKSGLKMMKANGLLQIVEQLHLASKTEKDEKHMNFLYNLFIEEYTVLEKQMDSEYKRMQKEEI